MVGAKCPWCPFETKHKSNLNIHLIRHTGEKPYKCSHPGCSRSFGEAVVLKRHQAVHTNTKNFECPKCPQKFTTIDYLRCHMRTHDTSKPFACPVPLCGYTGRTKGFLRTHTQTVHSTHRPFKCTYCDHGSKTMSDLKKHLRTHSESAEAQKEPKHICPHSDDGCLYKSHKLDHLKNHIRSVHTKEKAFACEFCDRRFSIKSNLQSHLNVVHNRDKREKIKCPLCPYSTVEGSHCNERMKQHISTHTGEKPFKCDHSGCTYAAITSSQVTGHARTAHYVGEKCFKCSHPNCDSSYTNLTALNRHFMCKHEEQKFVCAVENCGQKFTFNSSLQTHEQTHRLEKPFECSLCPFASKSKTGLRSHVQFLHEGKKFLCDFCGHASKSPYALRLHLRKHPETEEAKKEKRHKCPREGCPYKSFVAKQLKKHLATHEQKKLFACQFPNCDYRANHQSSLKNHLLYRHHGSKSKEGVKIYECRWCSYGAINKGLLEVHVRRHTGEKPFKCFFHGCNFTTWNPGSLRAHEKNHATQKAYRCQEEPGCQYSTNHRGNFQVHVQRRHQSGMNKSKLLKKQSDRGDQFVVSTCIVAESRQVCQIGGCKFSTNDQITWALHLNGAHHLPRVLIPHPPSS